MPTISSAFGIWVLMMSVISPICSAQVENWLFREVHSIKSDGPFFSVQFAPSGVPRLAVTSARIVSQSPVQLEKRTFIYDFPSMNPIDTIEDLSGYWVLTRDGKHVAMEVFTGSSYELQLQPYGDPNLPLRRLNLGDYSSILSMSTSQDGRYIYLAGAGGVRVVDISQDSLIIVDTLAHWFSGSQENRPGTANDVALSHSGDFLVSVSGGIETITGMKMWDASTHELIWERAPDTLQAYTVRWSPDDSRLLMILRDPWANFTRLEQRSSADGSLQDYIWAFGSYEFPYDAWYVSKGEYAITHCADTMIRAWDTKTLVLVEEFRPHNSVFTMDASPDGRYIATCADSTLRIFEVTTALSVSEPVAGEPSVRFSAPRPNPARDIVDIPFRLTRSGEIELLLTDIQGRILRILASGLFAPGNHSERIETDDLTSGMYYMVLKAEGKHYVQPIQIIR